MDVKYTHVITRYFPQSQHYSIGTRYEDIVWICNQVSKEDLDAKMLDAAKDIRSEAVREESIFIRSLATKFIVGTDDLYMLRTYDEKRSEAERLFTKYPTEDMKFSENEFRLLKEEARRTGVTTRQLASAVLEQYDLAAEFLNPVLGDIEAVRRNIIVAIYECTTMDQLSDLADPEWPDLSFLQAI